MYESTDHIKSTNSSSLRSQASELCAPVLSCQKCYLKSGQKQQQVHIHSATGGLPVPARGLVSRGKGDDVIRNTGPEVERVRLGIIEEC